MIDHDKLLGRLDVIDGKINDFTASRTAELMEIKEGTEKVVADLDAQRKQLQEIAEVTKRIPEMPKGVVEEKAALAQFIVHSWSKPDDFVAEQRALSEGTDAAGGFLVADEQVKTIRQAQENYGVVRRLWTPYPMQSDVTQVPVDEYLTDDAWTVSVYAENAQIAATDAEIRNLTLTAEKIATLTYISSELLQDSFVDVIGTWLTEKLARKAAHREDSYVFSDTTYGLEVVTGLQTTTIASTAYTGVTGNELIQAEDDVVSDALNGAKFLAHRSVLNIVRTLKDGNSAYVWGASLVAGSPPTINGYGVERVEVMPKRSASTDDDVFAYFGDMNMGYIFGERGGERLDASRDFRFDYDQTALRWIERIAGNSNAQIGKAITKITTST
jgi:HK97 family phage major capsid protein